MAAAIIVCRVWLGFTQVQMAAIPGNALTGTFNATNIARADALVPADGGADGVTDGLARARPASFWSGKQQTASLS